MSAPTTTVRLMPKNEAAWYAAAALASGAYSPLGGAMSINFLGGIQALKNKHQVDIAGVEPGDYSRVYEATDANGHTWYCRWVGTPLWFAFRDRTDDEIINEIEGIEDRTDVSLRRSALAAMRRISLEINYLADEMRPESCPSRSRRRELKHRLAGLSALQHELLCSKFRGREIRERMDVLGVPYGGIDYQGWLDRRYQ
jgi:hypothetical protein